jgi:hypothetical protein
MSAALTKRTVERVIGQTRLRRLLRAGWISPVGRNGQAILFDPLHVHAALRRMERSVVPPDKIEVARVRASEARNGHPRVRKTADPPPPDQRRLEEIEFELDFSSSASFPDFGLPTLLRCSLGTILIVFRNCLWGGQSVWLSLINPCNRGL